MKPSEAITKMIEDAKPFPGTPVLGIPFDGICVDKERERIYVPLPALRDALAKQGN